ncbi:hypothetical protein SLEP1_g46733 [Rubroshorea leprosula]|uniref:Uncharacterized protein n=1 Tax=Rubroshorea leprosula TaxID=152421 RepID=A0AAV5LN78_9ROSI|nr:hypothetical protein SLEP1_g46733 [Rubroshorea leprosula]
MTDSFNSLLPTLAMAELKGNTKRGELTSLKGWRRADILSRTSISEISEEIRLISPYPSVFPVINAGSAFEGPEHSSVRNQASDHTPDHYFQVKWILLEDLQSYEDSPETMASEGSASSSARDDGGDHPTALSSSSSTEETPNREEGMGDVVSSVSDQLVVGEWEGVTIPGRLHFITK